MSEDFGTTYTYTNPDSGEQVQVAGAEGHHDQFGVLFNEDDGQGWKFEAPQQTRREAELAIDTLQPKRPSTRFAIVKLLPTRTEG